MALRDPQARLSSLLEFAKEIEAWEIPSAISLLHERTPEWDPDAQVTSQMLYTRWGKADPEAALAQARQLGFQSDGDEITFVMAAVAAEEPRRALDWLEAPGNKLAFHPFIAPRLAGAITKEWARLDPQAAVDWALATDHSQRAGAMGGALGTIATTSPELLEASLEQWQTLFPHEAAHWQHRFEF